MSTTCLIDNQLDEGFYLLTTPELTPSDANPWGPDAFYLTNTCVGSCGQAPIVTLNRDVEIKDGRFYYMKTEVKDIHLNLMCTLTEKLKGTFLASDIWFKIESGDGQHKTGWINSDNPTGFNFRFLATWYQITPKWISQDLGFDNIQYTLSVLG